MTKRLEQVLHHAGKIQALNPVHKMNFAYF
jgi:hypothetical protein